MRTLHRLCVAFPRFAIHMQVSADSEEPRTQLFATFESDVARVGKPAPVAHLVDRIQVLTIGLPASIQIALVL